MKNNSNSPEENMVKLVLPKYFVDSTHTTNVITLFAIVKDLRIVYKMADKTYIVSETVHLLKNFDDKI